MCVTRGIVIQKVWLKSTTTATISSHGAEKRNVIGANKEWVVAQTSAEPYPADISGATSDWRL